MSVMPSALTRATAVATVVAGLLHIVMQPLHRSDELTSVTGSTWNLVDSLSLTTAILGLAGVTGLYLRQVREFGVLGLSGYVLFSLFFVLQAAFPFAETFIVPLIAAVAPELTQDVAGLFAAGQAARTHRGPLAVVPLVGAVFCVMGGLLFGAAVLRARILSRLAAILLIAASSITPLAALLPHDVERLLAIPFGLALVWLGLSLLSDQRRTPAQFSPLGEKRTPVEDESRRVDSNRAVNWSNLRT